MASDNRCDRQSEDFPGVVALGSFAHNLGCRLVGVRMGDERGTLAELTPRGLAAAGWAEADQAERSALALRWTEQVALAHHRAVTRATDGRRFAPPEVSASEEHVEVALWVFHASTNRGSVYRRYRLRYARSDGSLEGPEQIGTHTVSPFREARLPVLQPDPPGGA